MVARSPAPQPRPPSPDLAAVVEDAYRVFGRYAIAGNLVVCHCDVCMTEKTERQLVATPLRRIPARLMAEYTNSAHGYDEGQIADELRYLLPRYLDLIAADDPPDHFGNICSSLSRLWHAHWRDRWPSVEADVLNRFFDALIVDRLSRIEPARARVGWQLRHDIDEILICVVTSGGDIDRVLDTWDTSEDPAAALWMAWERRNIVLRHGRPRFYDAHLDGDHKDAADRIGAFLWRPEVDARIEAAFFAAEHPGLQEILSNGLG